MRREIKEEDDDDSGNFTHSVGDIEGLNTFCLVSRTELPSSTNNLFYFADIDRDSLVDMLFVTKNDMSLHIYYNKLLSLYQQRNQKGEVMTEGKGFGMKNLCAQTNREVNYVRDAFAPFNQMDEKYVVKQSITTDNNAQEVMYIDDHQNPSRMYIGDITSDGFPDILISIKYIDGFTKSRVLVNSACDSTSCNKKAANSKRRFFQSTENQY